MSTMKNPHYIEGDTCYIAVKYRDLVLICKASAAAVSKLMSRKVTWFANPARGKGGKYYATVKMGGKTILMHRFLMNAGRGDEVHHADNDGLNNCFDNLSFLVHQRNIREHWPGRDWTGYDAKQKAAKLYRAEREIALLVQQEFKLTRQGLWKIRTGLTVGSKAAMEYGRRLEEKDLKTLAELRAEWPRAGKKWGVFASGREDVREPW